MTESRDQWAEWIAARRFGSDEALADEVMSKLQRVRDDVLAHASISPGDVVLDVGCGDGLLGFGAVDRVGEDGEVVFSDISRVLLDECRRRAAETGLRHIGFVEASADDLSPIADESVDVVLTRSVLIYVADKPAAFREFHRVLRPHGRISLFEPINRFNAPMHAAARFCGYSAPALADLTRRVREVFERLQPRDSDPMLDFDERDLLRLASGAGFFPLHLRLEAAVTLAEPRPWDTFLNAAWNPRVPTVQEAISEVLTPEEQARLTAALRPLVEKGEGELRSAVAYVWGSKG